MNTRRTQHNKLVRDLIPEICERNGDIPVVRVLGDDEYRHELRRKLQEEVEEFLRDGDSELPDLIEVIHALAQLSGIDAAALERMRGAKAEKRGGFAKRLFLIETRSEEGAEVDLEGE